MNKGYRAAFVALLVGIASLFALPATAAAYLQCVPFARAASGIELRGNARDWWQAAAGRYDRGNEPRVGAVMHFPGTRAMPVGHVAVVSRIVSDREILIDHANWSPINGRRGQVERGALVRDVSAAGDWSMVRVWYAPIRGLGLRPNPVSGFIYPAAAPAGRNDAATRMADATPDPHGRLAAIVSSL